MINLSTSLVDTDVFSLLYVRRPARDARIPHWREYLAGRRVVISFQTRAEILVGARIAGWGERRWGDLLRVLDVTPMITPSDDVIDAYVTLTAECRRVGHALNNKLHAADRWIAACAIAKQVELLAGDGIFQGVPNLTTHN